MTHMRGSEGIIIETVRESNGGKEKEKNTNRLDTYEKKRRSNYHYRSRKGKGISGKKHI